MKGVHLQHRQLLLPHPCKCNTEARLQETQAQRSWKEKTKRKKALSYPVRARGCVLRLSERKGGVKNKQERRYLSPTLRQELFRRMQRRMQRDSIGSFRARKLSHDTCVALSHDTGITNSGRGRYTQGQAGGCVSGSN